MQSTNKKRMLMLIFTALAAITSIVFRIFIMNKNFDFESKFFSSNSLATFVFFLVIILSVIIYAISVKIKTQEMKKTFCEKLVSAFCAITFVMLTSELLSRNLTDFPLQKILFYVSLVSAILSLIYYLFDIFSDSTVVRILNSMPVIYLISELIVTFTTISGKANSYYLFPEILSSLMLAYLILTIAKHKVDKNVSIYCVTLVSIIILSFSVIPDSLLLILSKLTFTSFEIYLLIFKTIYLIYSVYVSIRTIKTLEEK